MNRKKSILLISILITYIFGYIGFQMIYGNDILQSLYAVTCLFFMNILASAEEVNIYIEIARWSACFVSAQAVFLFLEKIFSRVKSAHVLKDENVIVLHGDNAFLLKDVVKNSIVFDHDVLWKAKRHLFYFSKDQSLFDYLTQNSSYLSEEQRLYVMSIGINRNSFIKDYIQICNLSEMCARSYWRQYPLRFEEQKIVIIGNGSYVEEILDYAVLLNVISTDSQIEYHVFTKDTSYFLKHPQLCQCFSINEKKEGMDAIFIHNESWMQHTDLLDSCDRIVLADEYDEENLMILNCIKKDFQCMTHIDIRYLYKDLIHNLWGNDVYVFGTNEEVLDEEIILNDKSNYIAKNIHANYFKQYGCQNKSCTKKQCLSCEIFIKDWNHLSSFLRYSNVTQGEHMYYKIRILEHMRKDATQSLEDFYHSLSEEELLILDEIEHIRWNRYHYFHNWEYAPIRDNRNRKHPLLVPFTELSYAEKIKDRDAWENAIFFYKKHIL